ncbi:MAG: family 43 glycosylhydrolase, partial [Tunicatimonas sp.]
NNTRFRAYSSTDLTNWVDEGVIFDLETDCSWEDIKGWAPTVVYRNSKYYFYYTADLKIGVAVGNSPTGPFTDIGQPLIGSDPFTVDIIDPDVFVDSDGKAYIYYGGSNGSQMVYRELNPDMISLKTGAVNVTPPNYTEAPLMVKRNGIYYIMYSNGAWYNGSYNVRYATSNSPVGPWTYQGQVLSSGGTYTGPGHHGILKMPSCDEYYIIYHRYENEDYSTRRVAIDRMYFNADGSIRRVQMTDNGVLVRNLSDACRPGPPPVSGNLVYNPSFEESNLSGWSTWTNKSGSVYAEATGGYKGAKKLTHWNSVPYQASTNQLITGLTNGTYTLKAWVKASAGHTSKIMGVKNYGGNERSVSVPSTSTWTQITLPNVNVTNGQCEVYFWSDANAGGQWINVDLVEFVPASVNLVNNPSFEADNAYTQNPTGWSSSSSNVDADYAEGSSNSRTGSYRGTHWKGSAYQVYTYQTVTGLSNGSYTARAWVRSGGGQSTALFLAQNYGGNQRTVNIPATSTWTQVSIPNIQVTNGKCEVAFYSVAGANQWINFDDVELVVSGAGARTLAQSGKATEAGLVIEQELSTTALQVYPNPVSDALQIVLPAAEGLARVRIEDLQGRLVLDEQLSNRQSLDVSRLSPGTYLVRTWHGNQWHFQKLIKE